MNPQPGARNIGYDDKMYRFTTAKLRDDRQHIARRKAGYKVKR